MCQGKRLIYDSHSVVLQAILRQLFTANPVISYFLLSLSLLSLEASQQQMISMWQTLHIDMKSLLSWQYLMKDLTQIRSWNINVVSVLISMHSLKFSI